MEMLDKRIYAYFFFSFLITFRKVHKIRNAYLNELWQWIMTATAPVKKQNAARIPKAPSS